MSTRIPTNLVIHRSSLKSYSEARLSRYKEAQQVHTVIEKLLASDQNCVDWDSNSPPGDVASLFRPGDSVIIYGCYLRLCLSIAAGALENKGVTVSFSPDGCF